jgi:hypothetical protein
MTTMNYTQGDWSISVQTVATGKKPPWWARASRPNSGILQTRALYSSDDDAYAAILDLIDHEEAHVERFADFFHCLSHGGLYRVLRGDFDLSRSDEPADPSPEVQP